MPDQEESSEEEDNTGRDQRTRAAKSRKLYERSVRKSPFKNRLWIFEAPDSAAQLSISEFIPQLQLIADVCLYKLQYKEIDSESKKQYNWRFKLFEDTPRQRQALVPGPERWLAHMEW